MTSDQVRNCNLERIYRINYVDICGFVPGHNASGEQILMGVLDKELLVAFFFSPDGRFLRPDFFAVPWNPDPNLFPGQQQNRHAFVLHDAKRKWMSELGMTPGDIHIRHFAFPEWGIGISEWPLADFPEVQRAAAAGVPLEDEFLIEWRKQGRWVLHWHKEYWMTADGEIGDT